MSSQQCILNVITDKNKTANTMSAIQIITNIFSFVMLEIKYKIFCLG